MYIDTVQKHPGQLPCLVHDLQRCAPCKASHECTPEYKLSAPSGGATKSRTWRNLNLEKWSWSSGSCSSSVTEPSILWSLGWSRMNNFCLEIDVICLLWLSPVRCSRMCPRVFSAIWPGLVGNTFTSHAQGFDLSGWYLYWLKAALPKLLWWTFGGTTISWLKKDGEVIRLDWIWLNFHATASSSFLLSGLFSGENSAKHSVLTNNRQAQVLQNAASVHHICGISQVFCCPCARSLHSNAFQWINNGNVWNSNNQEGPKAWEKWHITISQHV